MYQKEKKIPTILALLVIFSALGGAIYYDRFAHRLQSSASVTEKPEDIHFTNISDTSFSVSWITQTPTVGSVLISNGTQMLLLDDTDSDNVSRPRYTHHTTVKNLKEDTAYQVKIISGNAKCPDQIVCPQFTQNTAPKLPLSTTLPPARGTIVNQQNMPAEGALVYLVVGKGVPLSGRVDSLGLWAIPLNTLRSQDLRNRLDLADNDIIQITGTLSPGKTTIATIDVKSIRNNIQIPQMRIGDTYDFINPLSKKDLLAKSNDQKTLGVQSQSLTNSTLDIFFPQTNGDTTSDTRPRFRGIGPKKGQLLITVNSAPQVGKVTVGPDGTWSWRPPSALPPGTHYISIQGYDPSGNLVTVKRTFIVLKSGERVLGEATASATLTPTDSPTATPVPTLNPTTTPPETPTVTTALSPTPTTAAVSITPTVSPPKTGSSRITLLLLGGAGTLIVAGLKFLLFP